MHTFGWSTGANALKNQRCELIFFAFFSFRQNMICTGTMPCSAPRKCTLESSESCVVYSYTCACTALSSTMFFATPSWYTPSAERQSSTRGLMFLRPSAMMPTTTLFQLPSPQTRLLCRVQRCAMFFITPCIVRQKSSSSSLYIVTPIKISVCRLYRLWRSVKLFRANSSASHVTAEYRMCVNSSESRRFTNVLSFVGIGQFSTRFPYVNATFRLTLCRRCCRPCSGAGPKCCVAPGVRATSDGFATRFSGATLAVCSGISGTPRPPLGAWAVSNGSGCDSCPSYIGTVAKPVCSFSLSPNVSWLCQLGGGSLPFERRSP